MPFSEIDRKNISKKIIDIPGENEKATDNAAALQDNIDKLKDQDKAIKDNFFDPANTLITGYHAEFALVNGEQRTDIAESQVVDSAKKILGNAFFPNDTTIPIIGPPSLPDGVWKEFKSYAGNLAKGKTQTGTSGPTVQKEQDLIDTINAAIGTVEAITEINRVTGLFCVEIPAVPTGFCTPTATPDTEAQCTIEGGVWTPPSPASDDIFNDTTSISALAALDAAIAAWEAFIVAEIPTITVGDSDAAREALNVTAIADANNTITIIDTWQALLNFDPDTFTVGSHPPGTCAIFNGTDPNTLLATRLRQAELNILKAEITARETFLVTRDGELSTNLGDITQNTDGSIASQSGLYGDRYTALDLRINLITGFLTLQFGGELGQRALNESVDNNNTALGLFDIKLKVSKFISAGNGSTIIHVEDNTEFNPLDSIFIVSDNQSELIGQVLTKSGANQITLDISISNRYNDVDNSRIVKDLS